MTELYPPILTENGCYEKWRNDIQRWQVVTAMEPKRRALAVRANLYGKAREEALKLDAADLNHYNGMSFLMNALDAHFRRIPAAYSNLNSVEIGNHSAQPLSLLSKPFPDQQPTAFHQIPPNRNNFAEFNINEDCARIPSTYSNMNAVEIGKQQSAILQSNIDSMGNYTTQPSPLLSKTFPDQHHAAFHQIPPNRISFAEFNINEDCARKRQLTRKYNTDSAKTLLSNRSVAVIGDSVLRSVYKDLVLLVQQNRFLSSKEITGKGENSFMNDAIISFGKNEHNVRTERRVFKKQDLQFKCQYNFVTKVYNDHVESVIKGMGTGTDIVIISSCLWDVSRYGGVNILEKYDYNLDFLIECLVNVLPESLIIWLTTSPITDTSGYLNNLNQNSLRAGEILQCNKIARAMLKEADTIYGRFKVIDLEEHFRFLQNERAKDGVHWNAFGHRQITSLILDEINKYYNILPSMFFAENLLKECSYEVLDSHSGKRKRPVDNEDNRPSKRINNGYPGYSYGSQYTYHESYQYQQFQPGPSTFKPPHMLNTSYQLEPTFSGHNRYFC